MPAKTGLIKWQLPMKRVLLALLPIALSAVYFYGWRVVVLLAVANTVGFLTEYAFARKYNEPVTSAVFVTCSLLVMSLPPPIPVWMVVVGTVFGVTFGKMVFGGFGKNVFNPALTGRAFLYISFGAHMTAMWHEPVGGLLGGFAAYAPCGPDAITQATPGIAMKTGASMGLLPLFLGNTSGTIGGTCAPLVILGGLYLVYTKAANYRIVISGLAGFLLTGLALWAGGIGAAVDPIRAALGGSLIFGVFFYATDPVSASSTNEGRWIYGAFVGAMSAVISVFSAWPAGTMFAILLANMFAPIMDHAIRKTKARRKAQGKSSPAKAKVSAT